MVSPGYYETYGYGSALGGYGYQPGSSVYSLTTQWRGHYFDYTGMVYMGARYYEPASGRFLSADPLGNASSMALYDYCNGDPVNGLDPDGRLGKGALEFAGMSDQEATDFLDPNAWDAAASDLAGGYATMATNYVNRTVADIQNTAELGYMGGVEATSSQTTMQQKLAGGAVFTAAAVNIGLNFIPGEGAVENDLIGGVERNVVNAGGDGFTTFYHGTTSDAAASIRENGIDLSRARSDQDFGQAFYTTTNQALAQDWANRVGGEVLTFQVPNSALANMSHYTFDSAEEWANFVSENISGQGSSTGFNMISGPIVKNINSVRDFGAVPLPFGQQTAFTTSQAARWLYQYIVP